MREKIYIIEDDDLIENNVTGTFGVITKTVKKQKHEALHETLQIAQKLKINTRKKHFVNLGIFKGKSNNVTKSLRIKQKKRMIT